MSPECAKFVEGLATLIDVETDDYLVAKLYDLCDLIMDAPDASTVIPHIFAFMESHPEADFGAKGPLVHFLESRPRPDYEHHLIASLNRKATYPAVLMVNAILNGNVSSAKRSSLLALLHSISSDPNADAAAQSHAELFLKHQKKRQRHS
jgi:hypothetical protein